MMFFGSDKLWLMDEDDTGDVSALDILSQDGDMSLETAEEEEVDDSQLEGDDEQDTDDSQDDGSEDEESEDAGDASDFDEALVAHAEDYGLDIKLFPTEDALRTQLSKLDEKLLSTPGKDSGSKDDEKAEEKESQTKEQPSIPSEFPEFEIKVELDDDIDPEIKEPLEAVVGKIVEAVKDRDKLVVGALEGANKKVHSLQMASVAQSFEGWLEKNEHSDIDAKQKGEVWDNAAYLGQALRSKFGPEYTITDSELFRRAYNMTFAEKAEKEIEEAKETKTQKRRRQTTNPPNQRGRSKKPKSTDYKDMPEGVDRAAAWIESQMKGS